jgi:hypothetical protein
LPAILCSAALLGLLIPVHAQTPCPDDDLDSFADCSVAGCDATGLSCGDCDDGDPLVYPGGPEICDHKDNDCAGAVDEGFVQVTSFAEYFDRWPASNEHFGSSLASIGDVNWDGLEDFVVGSPDDNYNGLGRGQVTLISGADRRALCRTPDVGLSGVGRSVIAVGDIDGDLAPDFASATSAGVIVVFSGASCAEVSRCNDPLIIDGGLGHQHGLAARDLDGDGVSEIIAGAYRNVDVCHHCGKAAVFAIDGTTRSCTLAFEMVDPAPVAYDNLGFAVTALDDVTGDAVPDIAVGEPGDDTYGGQTGSVLIFSGADGTFLRELTDPVWARDDHLGSSVGAIRGLDTAGLPGVAAGVEFGDGAGGSNTGRVVVFSATDGSVLRRAEDPDAVGGERIGWSLSIVGDIDGDGLQDVVAGGPLGTIGGQREIGNAVVFSTAPGCPKLRVLMDHDSAEYDHFGWAVAGTGDLTGDGIPELLVGVERGESGVGVDSGSYFVFALESDCDLDGRGPFFDCDDQEVSLWSLPSEVSGLEFTDEQTIVWMPPVDSGNSSGELVYDLIRSDSVVDFMSSTCIETADDDLVALDPDLPDPAGALFCYLARANNDCGNGHLGLRTIGEPPNPRDGTSCP